jgi:hypothetical protein
MTTYRCTSTFSVSPVVLFTAFVSVISSGILIIILICSHDILSLFGCPATDVRFDLDLAYPRPARLRGRVLCVASIVWPPRVRRCYRRQARSSSVAVRLSSVEAPHLINATALFLLSVGECGI